MTALAKARPITEARWKYKQFTLASGHIGYQGGAAVLDKTSGKVVPGALGTTFQYLGLFAETVDATAGDALINVNLIDEIALIWFANGTSSDAVAATNVGSDCYFLDDNTVSILATGKSVAGRVMAVDTVKGVAVQKSGSSSAGLSPNPTLPAFAAGNSAPTDIVNNAVYAVPTTAATSTITLPAITADGTVARFIADGTANGNTVQYVDATGSVNLTTALTASKRHCVIAVKTAGKWFANAYVSP